MKSTPSPRVRVLAVLALVAAAGAATFVLMRSPNTASSPAVIQTTHTTAQTTTTSTTSTTKKSRPKPHVTKPKQPQSGMAALDAALVARPVVVVSLYSPDVATDVTAMKEARAGAASVGAGFVAFNVYNEKQARQIATLLGSDSQAANPEVLFFERPRALAFELHGFADSQVVAQAAENVYPHEEPWVNQANGICAHYAPLIDQASTFGFSFSGTLGGTQTSSSTPLHLDQLQKLFNNEMQALSAVRPTVSKAASYARFVADYRQGVTLLIAEIKAFSRGDKAQEQALAKQLVPLGESINTLVTELHLTSCVA